jgi:fermentation-respiration switch protein FrsA (DUF1100 family)
MTPTPQPAEVPETPAPKRTWWAAIRRRLYVYGGIYLGVLLVLLWLENWFLYRPTTFAEAWQEPPAGLVVEDVTLTTEDGNTIHAWWATPPGWTPAQGAILYSHGNAGNLSQRGRSVKVYHDQGHAVLIYDYPGYGKSPGKSSEKGIYAAGEACYRWLTDVKEIPGKAISLYGGSLGGAVAVELAARHPARVLIMVAAFTSFPDMAQRQFPIFPTRWLVAHQLNNLAKIATVNCPVFVTHGTADRTIPFSMGERLYEAAPQPKAFLPMPEGGHNDGVGSEYSARLRAFLDEHAPLR